MGGRCPARGAGERETFHTLRHTFASWLVQRGLTLLEVKDTLGHQTITMSARYAHLAPDHLRAAVAVLDGVLAVSNCSTQEVVELVEASQKSL